MKAAMKVRLRILSLTSICAPCATACISHHSPLSTTQILHGHHTAKQNVRVIQLTDRLGGAWDWAFMIVQQRDHMVHRKNKAFAVTDPMFTSPATTLPRLTQSIREISNRSRTSTGSNVPDLLSNWLGNGSANNPVFWTRRRFGQCR